MAWFVTADWGRTVQRQIAANWQALYKKVFGIAPTG